MRVLADEDRSRLYMVMEWLDGRLLRTGVDRREKTRPGASHTHRTRNLRGLGIYSQPKRGSSGFEARKHHGGLARSNQVDRFRHRQKRGSQALDLREDHTIDGHAGLRLSGTGETKRGDARSDLYSLGVIFYEMLTGEVPFQGPNPIVVLNDRLVNNPIPPREINPQISFATSGDHLPRSRTQSSKPLSECPRHLRATSRTRMRSS